MATDLTFGSVPPFYREVYDIVCPNQEHVDHDMFLNLLVKSSLPKQTLSQVWEMVDSTGKQGALTRNGLYKVLALTALAQQGKTLHDRILESFTDQELPKPQLGDLSDLKSLSIKMRRQRAPNVLGFTYSELKGLDTIRVELVPEKKGLILKHVEYEVSSKRYKSTVLRRYNDFVAYQEVLLMRYPYRMVPKLPPKKIMGADREFIEQRRKSLQRFLNLIIRHPVLTDDKIVQFFHTFNGSDLQYKIKEHFRGEPDEFMTCQIANKAKDLVPLDTQMQFSNSRELIRVLTLSVGKLKDIAERMVIRATTYASDMLQIGKELSVLSHDATPASAWACGMSTTWSQLKTGFKKLSVEYKALADKASSLACREEEAVVEDLHFFLSLLSAYKDLCDRQEKGVLHDHQRALHKMGQYKKKQMSATLQGPSDTGAVEQLEERILQQESEISNMENRNYYSLHCVQMETQLIHANLAGLFHALENMVNEEARSHHELSEVWLQIKPLMSSVLAAESIRNGSTSPRTISPRASPVGSPSTEAPGITV